jgi:predicted CopG family antitoxin
MSRLISVSEDVYYELAKLKSDKKSFTKTISELLQKNKGDINDLFGTLKISEEEARKLKQEIKKERLNFFNR